MTRRHSRIRPVGRGSLPGAGHRHKVDARDAATALRSRVSGSLAFGAAPESGRASLPPARIPHRETDTRRIYHGLRSPRHGFHRCEPNGWNRVEHCVQNKGVLRQLPQDAFHPIGRGYYARPLYSKPNSSITFRISAASAVPSTATVPAVRSTSTAVTEGSSARFFSTLALQWLQLMPPTR